MSYIVWNESYSVGVAELDAHHRQLADLINQLAEYRQPPSSLAAIDDVLSALVDYAAYHFKAEETLLARCKFPDLAAQQTEHLRFCESLAELRFGASLGIVSIERLFIFLTRWWIHHIGEEDMKYKPFLVTAKV